MNAREAILRRVREGLAAPRQTPDAIRAEHAALPRAYQQEPQLERSACLELFRDRLRDYDALVHDCAPEAVASTLASVLTARGRTGLLVPPGFPQEWRPAGLDLVSQGEESYLELDASAGAVTDCALAIAVTGTLVLRHAPERGKRSLSLIPDYLLCVVRAEQVVESVPEAIRQLADFGNEPLTTISGPSATADIEMTRIKGVHGPRTLEVLLVSETPSRQDHASA